MRRTTGGPAQSDPTPSAARTRVLAVLRSADAPLTAEELGRRLGLHPTTVRFHLDRLASAGVVTSTEQQTGRRGRPALRYRAVSAGPSEDSGHAVASAWKPMVEALATMLDDDPQRRERASAAGVAWADEIWARHPAGITAVFAQLGFSPQETAWGARLRSCPFVDSARRHPDTVCAIHHGLACGLAEHEGLGGQVVLRPFAEPAACHLLFDRDAGDPGRGENPPMTNQQEEE